MTCCHLAQLVTYCYKNNLSSKFALLLLLEIIEYIEIAVLKILTDKIGWKGL